MSEHNGLPDASRESLRALVLLVDDEPHVREAAAALLRSLGYEVVTVGSGAEAVSVLSSSPDSVSLAVLDIIMPGMDGLATLAELRRLKPRLPVLLSSGATPGQDVAKALELEAVQFLTKPYTRDELAARLRQLLEDAE